jgi:hypothetical protein
VSDCHVTGTYLRDKHLFAILVTGMKKIALLNEEEGNIPDMPEMIENAKPVSGFRLQFLSENERQVPHKVDVRCINMRDLLRHLRQGESVLITPKLQEDFSVAAKRLDREAWYFTHM